MSWIWTKDYVVTLQILASGIHKGPSIFTMVCVPEIALLIDSVKGASGHLKL